MKKTAVYLLLVSMILCVLFSCDVKKEPKSLPSTPFITFEIDATDYYETNSFVGYLTNNSDGKAMLYTDSQELFKLTEDGWVYVRSDEMVPEGLGRTNLSPTAEFCDEKLGEYKELTPGTYMFTEPFFIPVEGHRENDFGCYASVVFELAESFSNKEDETVLQSTPFVALEIDAKDYYETNSFVGYLTNNSGGEVTFRTDLKKLFKLTENGWEYISLPKKPLKTVVYETISPDEKYCDEKFEKYEDLEPGTYMFTVPIFASVEGYVEDEFECHASAIFELPEK